MATLPSALAWRIPWTEEPGRLQSVGLQRVGPQLSDYHNSYVPLNDSIQIMYFCVFSGD